MVGDLFVELEIGIHNLLQTVIENVFKSEARVVARVRTEAGFQRGIMRQLGFQLLNRCSRVLPQIRAETFIQFADDLRERFQVFWQWNRCPRWSYGL